MIWFGSKHLDVGLRHGPCRSLPTSPDRRTVTRISARHTKLSSRRMAGTCQGVSMVPRFARPVLPFAVALAIAGCGSRLQTKPLAVAPTPPPAPSTPAPTVTPAPANDPIAALIAVSQEHFRAGQQELSIGHLDRARLSFNQALDVLLQSPYG